MSKFVFTDASLTVGGVDLSDHVESVTLAYQSDAVETTSMGDSARTYVSGLTDATIQVSFFQDYDAASVNATLFPLVGGAATSLVIKPTSGAVAATNPSYTMNCVLTDYTGPVDASVGDAAKASATFQGSGGITETVI